MGYLTTFMSENQSTMSTNQSATGARWRLGELAPPAFISQFPEHPPAISQLLYNRNLRDDDAVAAFLQPVYTRDLHDPYALSGMEQAVRTVSEAIKAGERLVVHGDYDADGITAAALLCTVLASLGADVHAFIPDRYTDGYGLSAQTLHRLHQEGAKLVVSVDCGISSAAAIAKARQAGLKVVVTDHHVPPRVLPDAEAVVNPHLPGDQYPNKALTGVGVAFKVAQALLSASNLSPREQEAAQKWLLDLVALGTVADLASLTGENRALVKYGLTVLRKTRRPGLKALMRVAGIDPVTCDSQTIGYALAPRLNAAGRITHAKHALDLLLSVDEEEAARLAVELNDLNTRRQDVTMTAVEEAKRRLGAITDDDRIIVLDGEWISGIVGLVAGRLTQEYSRPSLVIERGPKVSRGSARSIPALNILETLAAHKAFLSTYGGHAGAAGFSLPTEKLADFREALTAFARQSLSAADIHPELFIDAELAPQDVTWETLEQLQQFEPFGAGNRKPLLLLRRVKVSGRETVGKDKTHLKLRLELPDGNVLQAIAFGLAHAEALCTPGADIDLVGTPVANSFNNTQSLEWHVNDFRRP